MDSELTTLKELFGLDPQGNVMPQGMFWRKGIYYVYKRVSGRRLKRTTGKRDFKSAMRRYHEIMKDWNDGASGWKKALVPTVNDYWEKHYRPTYTVLKTPDSRSGDYRDDSLAAHGLEYFRNRPLDQITKADAQRWLARRRASTYSRKAGGTKYHLSEGTLTREKAFWQTLFERAKEEGLIDNNPWALVKTESYDTKTRVLTESEQAVIEPLLLPKFRRWLLFMLGTGLRLQEARGINEREHVNFARRSVHVTRKTKGLKKKTQDIPLIDPVLLDILQEQLADEGELWHVHPTRFRQVLAVAGQKAGIAHLSPHTLRHTFATRYLKGGGDIYVLSKILGHDSVKTTEKIYAHLLGDDLLARSQGINLGLVGPRVVPFKREA